MPALRAGVPGQGQGSAASACRGVDSDEVVDDARRVGVRVAATAFHCAGEGSSLRGVCGCVCRRGHTKQVPLLRHIHATRWRPQAISFGCGTQEEVHNRRSVHSRTSRDPQPTEGNGKRQSRPLAPESSGVLCGEPLPQRATAWGRVCESVRGGCLVAPATHCRAIHRGAIHRGAIHHSNIQGIAKWSTDAEKCFSCTCTRRAHAWLHASSPRMHGRCPSNGHGLNHTTICRLDEDQHRLQRVHPRLPLQPPRGGAGHCLAILSRRVAVAETPRTRIACQL